jgi:hypothetical protein
MLLDLVPRALKAELKFKLILLPKDMFARLPTQDTIFRLPIYQLSQFDKLGNAQAWLELIE